MNSRNDAATSAGACAGESDERGEARARDERSELPMRLGWRIACAARGEGARNCAEGLLREPTELT
jgi:hypothetical protein